MKILNRKLFRLSLQFFAEGTGAGGAEGEGTAAPGEDQSHSAVDEDDVWMAEMEQKYGVTNGVASAQAIEAANAKRSVAHSEEAAEPKADAKKAEEEEKAAQPTGEKTPEEEFDELIKSDKFKGLFTQKVSAAVQDRFKAQTDAKTEADQYRATLTKLAGKYGKSAEDIQGIMAAIEADDSLLEDEAYKKGKTVEEIRAEQKSAKERAETDGEIAKLRNQLKEYENRENARRDAATWMEQAKETKSIYGDNFDLKTELQNPDFLKYLQRDRKSVTEAFEMAHYKEIMASQLKAVERRADENAAKAVAANKARIKENAGTYRVAGESPRIDVRNMTDADHAKIDAMIARGEAVTIDYFR